MSWWASGYIKAMRVSPAGDPLTRDEKFVALILAEYHDTERNVSWPGTDLLAADALMSRRHCIDVLRELERKDVIGKLPGNGRGHKSEYFFPHLPATGSSVVTKDAPGAPFIPPKNLPKRVQKGCTADPQTVQKGCTCAYPHKEEPMEPKKPVELSTAGAALKGWLGMKAQLKTQLAADEWSLWVRPAYLLKVMGDCLLVALPPNGRIMAAARARAPALQELAREFGYGGAMLTRYPDDYERERIRDLYPAFYEQMLGNRTVEARNATAGSC